MQQLVNSTIPEGYRHVCGNRYERTCPMVYSSNYKLPIIPPGFSHVDGFWNSGFIVESPKGNQYVWIPVGSLPSNGVLGGSLLDKFGRRNYHAKYGDRFLKTKEFHEPITLEMIPQIESVQKYGGFFISRYDISHDISHWEIPVSKRGNLTWSCSNFNEAKELAKSIENEESVSSHLIYGAEYDSMLQWFITSKARTFFEVVEDSTNWGNYFSAESRIRPRETGYWSEWCTNNLYDVAGNLWEWTQELYLEKSLGSSQICNVIRGGDYSTSLEHNGIEDYGSVSCRVWENPCDPYYRPAFRIALCIK